MNFLDAIEKHKEIFPMATPQMQLAKFIEEYFEYQDATTQSAKESEYGDMMFVILSFRRFDETKALAEKLLDRFYFSKRFVTQKRIMLQVANAIKRTEKRNYYLENGYYVREKSLDKR